MADEFLHVFASPPSDTLNRMEDFVLVFASALKIFKSFPMFRRRIKKTVFPDSRDEIFLFLIYYISQIAEILKEGKGKEIKKHESMT